MSARVAGAAEALVGARFRLHGRDPATGLDCLGVAAAALAGAGWRGRVPTGYPLRGGDATQIAARIDAVLPRAAPSTGAIVLVATGPGQFHFAVLTARGFVHADAALRRVVERPGTPPWPVLGAWAPQGDA